MTRASWLLAILVLLLAAGCPAQDRVAPPATPASAPAHGDGWRVSKSGLGFRLSEVDEAPAAPPAAAAKTAPLSPEATKKLLARLPALEAEPGDEKDAALRAKSLPRPRAGKTVEETFPPPGDAQAPAVAAGPLKVTRRAPTGEVPLAPSLAVSFSQPMVALTSHGDLAATAPPIQLRPQPPGEWRWLGAQTAVFQPEPRFPMATEYRVSVPAGTRAASGQALAAADEWTFATPPAKVTAFLPSHGPTRLDPLLYAEFDQRVDPEQVLASARVAAGGAKITLRAATAEEIDGDDEIRRAVAKATKELAGRWIALRANERLPAATTIHVTFAAGLASAEGPRRTTADQTFSFATFGRMRVTEHQCGWEKECPPLSDLRVAFSNPIDLKAFQKSMVRVAPEIAGMKIEARGASLSVSGKTKGRTQYTVTVSGAIADTFGQRLGEDAKLTFDVGRAAPRLFPEEHDLAVLDPAGPREVRVFSVNRPMLKVRVYAVRPEDYRAYQLWRNDWDDKRPKDPPGRLVVSRTIATRGEPDDLTGSSVDLGPALKDGLGQAIVVVEPTTAPPKDRWRREWYRSWVQATRLGLAVVNEPGRATAWTTALDTGAAAAGVDVSAPLVPGARATSDPRGLAQIDARGDLSLIVARRGDDVVFTPDGARPGAQPDRVAWLVVDDRQTYKPGEEGKIKGWVRRLGMAKGGDVGAVNATGATWSVADARGNEVGKGAVTLDATSGFDFTFRVPDNANLGPASVRLELTGVPGGDGALADASHVHGISFEEFRRPEFEVTMDAGEGPFYVGDHAVVTVAAKYYAGGGLPNAPASWRFERSVAHFTPPGLDEYAFGKAPDFFTWIRAREGEKTTETWDGKTSAAGEHRLRVDFDALDPPYPMKLVASASVVDVNRQSWSSQQTLIVHPAAVSAGLRLDRGFVRAGEPIGVQVVAADVDGKLVAGSHVVVRAARLDWEQVGEEDVEKEVSVSRCELDTKGEASRCSLATKDGGRYHVVAVVTDPSGRRSQTEMNVWVFGDAMPKDRGVDADKVQVVLDKDQYRPGDVAEALVVAPFAPAEGLVTVRRAGVVRVDRFSLRGPTATLKIPIDGAAFPGLHVAVQIAGTAPREDVDGKPIASLPRRPAFAAGEAEVKVPPLERALDVKLAPRAKKVEPGASTVVDVELRDARGRPVPGATLAVAVVDEAVLALSAYQLPDPMDVFYPARDAGAYGSDVRSRVLLARFEAPQADRDADGIPDVADVEKAPGGPRGVGGLAPPPPPAPMASAAAAPQMQPAEGMLKKTVSVESSNLVIKVRKDFAALAAFVPRVTTDGEGHAEVPVKLPDSLTRYRVMAIAVAGDRSFGKAESTITARLPLMVRPSAPRFLNFGDRFDLPVVVQNQTDRAMDVDVAARATNAQLADAVGRRVTVPANDRVEVRLAASAVKPGKARFQVGVASGAASDAATVDLPVWTPATTSAFATYGQIDQGAVAQPVKVPPGVLTQFGGLEITTSSTALQALTDAVLYLVRYPFECNEQLASRVLAIAGLRDVLAAFDAKGLPKPEALVASVKADVERLRARQLGDGGWGFWESGPASPFLSVHVVHALQRAKEKGFDVPADVLSRGRARLARIEQAIPSYYSADARRAISAYALFVRRRMGDADRARAVALIAEAGGVDKLPLEAVGWLLPVLSGDAGAAREVESIRRLLANRVAETAGAAHFTTSYGDADYLLLRSDRRVDGVLLDALIGDQPSSDLIPKLVAGLLGHRTAGRWSNTQENAFVLLALDRYFRTYEKATPDFVARAWVGDRFAGEHAFKGRTTERDRVDVPMRALADMGASAVVVQKDGPGRLYFRIGMDYAPADLKPPPLERGFTVSRTYEGAESASDVRKDADGTWRVKAGSKVRVRVSMLAPSRRYHVALVDPLPAGLEPMNASLAVTGPIPEDPRQPASPFWWWSRTWYEHQNLRDERVEAFASLVWEGVHEYTYVARATTPGTFVVPPPKAEEMYAPETFGRGAGDRMIVE